MAREACDLVLVARDVAKAGRVAEDLQVRSPASTVAVVEADFLDAAAIGRLAAETATRPVDIVLIAHGMLPEQSLCENDLLLCRDTLEVNAVSPALFAEAFAGHFAMVEINEGVGMQVAVSLLGIVAMVATAALISWYKRIEGRSPGSRPGPPGATTLSGGGA